MTDLRNSPAYYLFKIQNPAVRVQKHRFLGKFTFSMTFNGDLPRSAMSKFLASRKIAHHWTANGGDTLYFNDEIVIDLAKALVDNFCLRQVVRNQEAWDIDAQWKGANRYRLVFSYGEWPALDKVSEIMGSASFRVMPQTLVRAVDGEMVEQVVALAIFTSDIVAATKLRLALRPLFSKLPTSLLV